MTTKWISLFFFTDGAKTLADPDVAALRIIKSISAKQRPRRPLPL